MNRGSIAGNGQGARTLLASMRPRFMNRGSVARQELAMAMEAALQ